MNSIRFNRSHRSYPFSHDHGQAMVEFALTIVLFLMIVFGIFEFARVFVTYSSVYAAAREAARYGAAVEDVGADTPRYLDCDGMRAAAKRVGLMGFISDPQNQIVIEYIPADSDAHLAYCPQQAGESYAQALGNRIKVVVTTTYQPLLGIIPPVPISSTSIRTIVSKVSIDQRQ